MKKKLLSLIMVLMLLPIVALFSACGKDGYNLNNLNTSFKEIVTENENLKQSGKGFEFDYSNHEKLNTAINDTVPYSELKDYNYVFNNLMGFTFEYIEVCSDNKVTDNVELKNEIERNLKDLKTSIHDVNECVNMLAEIINATNGNNLFEKVCLDRYKNLLKTYDSLFESAIRFNDSLTKLYFNHVLKDGNPNVYEKVGAEFDTAKFDANVVVNKINSRIKFQVANLTKNYLETYVLGGQLAENIADIKAVFNLNYKNYQSNVTKISKQINETIAIERLNTNEKLEAFYNLSVQAYNIQETINNDQSKYDYACNLICYVEVAKKEHPTANELMCLSIIQANQDLINNYNTVLANMLGILGA